MLTDAVRLVYAFKRDTVPAGPDLYYANVSASLSLIKTSLYLIITVIYDAFIVSHESTGSPILSVHPVDDPTPPALAPTLLDRLGSQPPSDCATVLGLPR